jgi:hypothetical protein
VCTEIHLKGSTGLYEIVTLDDGSVYKKKLEIKLEVKWTWE